MPHTASSRWVAIRSRFPGAVTGPYLDVSARGLLTDGGHAALQAHFAAAAAGSIDKAALFDAVAETRGLFARLVGCHADEVAYTRNVTDGIAAFGAGLDWREGDSVVLCEELEHPANVYPWFGLARRFGLRVKNVAPEAGAVSIERIVDAIEPSTRVVAVSSVSFAPGFRLPVAELGIECRRRGVLLVVDTAQSIGMLHTDVAAWQADAIAASTQKGLMSLYGQGFLYVRRAVAETLKPLYLSRFGVEQAGHEASLGDPATGAYAAAARRFDVGNYNYPAVIAVRPAIKLLLELGTEAVEERLLGLARIFADRLLDLGLPVFGGRPGAHSSQIVTVGADLGYDHDAAGNLDMAGLYRHLTEAGVRLSIRRGLLRFSFHIYNNERDIETVAALAGQWIRDRAPRATRSAAD